MRKKHRTDKKKKTEKKPPVTRRITMVLSTKLPAPLEGICQPLWLIGAAFFTATMVQLIIPSLRNVAPLTAILSVVILVYAYIRKRSMVLTGYDEYVFKTLDYTYLSKYGKKPTGILLLGPLDNEEQSEIYHVAVIGRDSIPPLDWKLRVYVPHDAVLSEYRGRKFFSEVYAYQVEDDH